ncbi:serine/threonine protein kinase [Kribbella sp. VKM Ac-2527]|uniref:non-specific serine/threonine protein kinase n=1 Tax=Kribbella caucasensis TaxID=2512215 RepID=A0A4R6J3U4_9ACTN|nr:serine/threonine-protein kinase [Kribbella sp. VKM Ac-2527]TDO30034.1 serine/threonine protein kinase [Kribbella sp. VKM Ac-2527]
MSRRVVGDRYELEALPLARGGMGEVWVGRDVKLEREVAVKFLRLPDGTPDDELVRRFVRESRITARLEHPGIPAVYDVGTDEDRPYLVMQRIHGSTVADVVAENGPLPIGWAAAIAAQVCAVLTVAHRASLVHRDLKPSNLMFCPDGTVKVLDFGLAVALDLADISHITRTGQTIGTPAYMAPEQVMAALSGPQSDLYALGCCLHEMLTGRQTFGGPTPYSVMNKQVGERPSAIRRTRSDVPGELDELVLELLEKQPDDRPDSAEVVFERLKPFVKGLGPLAPVLRTTDGYDAVRMYAAVLAEVDSGVHTREVGRPPEVSVKVPTEQFSRGRLDHARQQATELIGQSRFSQAAQVLDAVAGPATQALGAADPAVVSLRLELANVLFEGGDYRSAAPVYRRLGMELAEHHGPDSDLVFRCRLQEATCRALIGETNEAITQLQALLEDETRVFGSADARTLELRRQIGLLQLGAGRVPEATRVLAALAADLERLHGHDHPLTEKVRGLLDGIRQREE